MTARLLSLPPHTVRGRIRAWIERHAELLGTDVLEVGSRCHDGAWWCNNRDLARGRWLGVDMQAGDGVDLVASIDQLPYMTGFADRFSGVLCSEVLEHVRHPWHALPNLRAVLQPGGWIIITTLTAFPIHAFPDDYWRFTESGLSAMLTDAGFVDIETGTAGEVNFELNDHDHVIARRICPIHVFALARRP